MNKEQINNTNESKEDNKFQERKELENEIKEKLDEIPKLKEEFLNSERKSWADYFNSILEKYDGFGTMSEYLLYKKYHPRHNEGTWLSNKNIKDYNTLETKLDDGSKAKYKLHLSVVPDDYNIFLYKMTDFLEGNKIDHKIASGKKVVNPEIGAQYGKVFTIYPKNKEDMDIIIKESKLLSEKYNIKGIPKNDLENYSEIDYANLSCEASIPETNNIVYYTIDEFDGNYIKNYNSRPFYMLKYLGQGPLDNLFKKDEEFKGFDIEKIKINYAGLDHNVVIFIEKNENSDNEILSADFRLFYKDKDRKKMTIINEELYIRKRGLSYSILYNKKNDRVSMRGNYLKNINDNNVKSSEIKKDDIIKVDGKILDLSDYFNKIEEFK